MESTLIHSITPDQITTLFNGLQNQISELQKSFQPKQPDELMTRAEVARMLDVDLSTLHNWNKKGKLHPVGIAGRVYYKRSDIEAALTPLNS